MTEKTETKPAAESKAPVTRPFVVAKTSIAPNGGRRDDIAHPGETVHLTAKQARYYSKMGYLAPYIEGDDDPDAE